tara:strand:+ start:262 stop:507 length:246 start_codon:yes stop_codon:yes gene_type:complete
MIIRKDRYGRKKGWFEEWLDLSFIEKLMSIMWCGFPYLVWVMCDGLEVWYKIILSIGIWILATLLCYWFGVFMSSDQRDWN